MRRSIDACRVPGAAAEGFVCAARAHGQDAETRHLGPWSAAIPLPCQTSQPGADVCQRCTCGAHRVSRMSCTSPLQAGLSFSERDTLRCRKQKNMQRPDELVLRNAMRSATPPCLFLLSFRPSSNRRNTWYGYASHAFWVSKVHGIHQNTTKASFKFSNVQIPASPKHIFAFRQSQNHSMKTRNVTRNLASREMQPKSKTALEPPHKNPFLSKQDP
ncbi:hypothetical protein BDP81DRAFT_84880 [Colletotrichum phormii]|uniref:Uncharacterized protein n=1 Tax=Colletotrichum phormii TaxID=359342 RepID=A0AAJ0A3V1_9PEZI|nr:uncharacterized protein BDP81DRAFT_84880 [Colletotrichum phormii]KAK1654532.1 hypothetical protein BDP81DRAFT_84880 [Colletotrichum phormii]